MHEVKIQLYTPALYIQSNTNLICLYIILINN